jgi:hypothetical protein
MKKYFVYGAFQNAGRPGAINYNEELIKECATLEEAQTTAENQRGAWDAVIIRDQEENEI